MREICVSGSTAFDMRMHFDGIFEEHGFNLSVISETFEKNHGGSGANIAYNLALLGENPILLSSVGSDYSFDGIMQDKVNLSYIHRDDIIHTAQSIIISDTTDNRMTFFHPGAMNTEKQTSINNVKEDIEVAIISPNHIPSMLEHAKDLNKHKKAVIIADPSQQITAMKKEEIRLLISHSNYFIANQYEYNEVLTKLSVDATTFISYFEAVVVTYGEAGSKIYSPDGSVEQIYAIDVEEIVDTTGAGDALRAGILFALIEGYTLKQGCQLGTLMASYCTGAPGAQYHYFTYEDLMEGMKLGYSEEIDLYKRRKY